MASVFFNVIKQDCYHEVSAPTGGPIHTMCTFLAGPNIVHPWSKVNGRKLHCYQGVRTLSSPRVHCTITHTTQIFKCVTVGIKEFKG